MAAQGLWNVGGINLPDFGISEKLSSLTGQGHTGGFFGIPNNAATNGGNVLGAQAPYGISPTPSQQSYIVNNPAASTPGYNGPMNPSPTGGAAPTSTQTTTSGGGGGGSIPSQPTSPGAPSGPSAQDELQSQLDAIFNPVFSSLGGQEQTLQQNYAPVEGQITAQGDLSKQTLADQQASGMRELGTQEVAAGGRKEDALTSASRLFNELQRGGQQRFGGASSAGEAYQTLTATEQQRRQGDIQKQYETAMQQVGTLKANLNDKYSTAVKEVQLQTQQAITDAQSQFRDALQSIQSARAQAQSDKAAASMNALQDLRNKVYAINQQSLQFAQQLALNHETTQKQVDTFTQKVLQNVTSGTAAVQQFNPQLNTSYGITPGQSAAQPTAYTGQTTARRPYNPDDPTTWA